MKTKFILKNFNTGEEYKKRFVNIDKVFEIKNKLERNDNSQWDVYAMTPFGTVLVFDDEKWKWR